MLDIKFIRKNLDEVRKALESRGMTAALDRFVEHDERYRDLLRGAEELKHQRNLASEEIATLKSQGIDPTAKFSELRKLSDEIKELDSRLRQEESEIQTVLLDIPNIPDKSVPIGSDPSDNVEVRRWGKPKDFQFEPKSHWEIGESLDIIDFARAAKIAQSRFNVLKGMGAKLERALVNFMLDLHTNEFGYTEIFPPILVNSESMTGTGQLPKFEYDAFHCEVDDLYLVPTAEVPLTNLYRDEILDAKSLPMNLTAYTPCFRREAGSYGRDTRGLIRQHQFNKVELVKFSKPEESYEELELLLENAEEVLKQLEIPYRVVVLCTGDLGFSAAKTYDLEAWLPSYGEYKEISSCSNFGDFQARRINVKYRPDPKSKPRLIHTLNGSGLAIGRTMAAILENYQRSDGKVDIPQALQAYTGFSEIA